MEIKTKKEKIAEIENKFKSIREILTSRNNPLYFFDNDVDGLASFLLLRKYTGKGKAVAIKSFPELSLAYTRKVNELMPDCVFVLDKPQIAKGFLEWMKQKGYWLIWIDHHQDSTSFFEYNHEENFIFVNPTLEIGINKPATYWVYELIKCPKDLDWIAALGCIGDWWVPEFIGEVYKKYKDLFEIPESEIRDAGKLIYETSFGKLVLLLNFGLKDTTTNVIRMTKFLSGVRSPYEILEPSEKNKSIHKRFMQINKAYQKLLDKAKGFSRHDVLFFQYGGNLSISAELSNALTYLYPNKIIVVAHLKGDRAKISIRSKYNIRNLVLTAVKDFENATAGGHENALGANVSIEDLPLFKDKLIKLWRIEKKKLAK